jgi:hypothetical protein
MTEETFWKILSIITLVVGYLIKALVDALKKDDKNKIYICPLDKMGIDSKMNDILTDIDKHEDKLNNIITTGDFNKSFIESIHELHNRIVTSLSSLVEISRQQTKLLEKMSNNK